LPPPLFRLDAMKEQMVRIVPTAHNLPTDRESVFYFNAQEIPAASNDDGNTLKIALRTRIKLFYRPKGCRAACSSPATAGVGDPPGGRRSAPAGVQPNAVPRLVHPYQGGRRRRDNEIDKPVMVAPFSTRGTPSPAPGLDAEQRRVLGDQRLRRLHQARTGQPYRCALTGARTLIE
jgi:chaperone protein EcpD